MGGCGDVFQCKKLFAKCRQPEEGEVLTLLRLPGLPFLPAGPGSLWALGRKTGRERGTLKGPRGCCEGREGLWG